MVTVMLFLCVGQWPVCGASGRDGRYEADPVEH